MTTYVLSCSLSIGAMQFGGKWISLSVGDAVTRAVAPVILQRGAGVIHGVNFHLTC